MERGYPQTPAKSLSFPSTPSLISSPPSFAASLFILHFLFSFTPSLEQKPDHQLAAYVTVAIVTEASQQEAVQ